MHARDDDDEIRIGSVVNRVWKAPKQASSGIAMYQGVELRRTLNSQQSVVQGSDEFCAQPRALLLVPNKCVFDIRGCRRTDNDLH
jgi:hypothetical protein